MDTKIKEKLKTQKVRDITKINCLNQTIEVPLAYYSHILKIAEPHLFYDGKYFIPRIHYQQTAFIARYVPPKHPFTFFTLAANTTQNVRFVRQAGASSFAIIQLNIKPIPQQHHILFSNHVEENKLPFYYASGIAEGLCEYCLETGVKDHLLTGLHVTLLDASFHMIDSKESSYKIATKIALNKAFDEVGVIALSI